MHDTDKIEKNQEKKTKRLLRKSAWAIGAGAGLFLLKVIVVPFLGNNEAAESALVIFSFCLMAYGGLLVLAFVFWRKMLFRLNLLLSWVIMPLVLVKLLMDFL